MLKLTPRHALLTLLILLIFLPRLTHLDLFLTPDEPLFLEHSRAFLTALRTADPGHTLGIGYPGVTLAWWSAPAIALTNMDDPMAAYAAGRLINSIVTGLLLLLIYLHASRLLGFRPAFIGVALLALDPYTLSYSRLLHIAMPLASFITLSGLSYLLWLRERRPRWLILTGLYSGLALLTKSTALLLLPMLASILGVWYFINRGESQQNPPLPAGEGRGEGQQNPPRPAGEGRGEGQDEGHQNLLTAHARMLLLTMLIFVLLWPAMWSDPLTALNLTFGKLLTDQAAGEGNLGMFWFGQFVEDPGPLFYPIALLLKATPWLLLGLLLSATHLIRRQQPLTTERMALWAFALSYLLIMTLASKKSIRYMLPAFPTLYLLMGLALAQLGPWLKRGSPHPDPLPQGRGRQPASLPLGGTEGGRQPASLPLGGTEGGLLTLRRAAPLLLLIPLLFLLPYQPYYFSYYNPLLLGWRTAPQILLVGWGEGLDQAAAYLHEQQQPKTVTAWYNNLFSVLYGDAVQPVVPPENMLTADYTVLYRNQVQRDIPNPNIIHYFRTRRQPEQIVRLAGIEYAWLYRGPIAGFTPPAAPQLPLTAQFADEARLLGYDLPPQPRSGEPLHVTLHWQVENPPSEARFVYVRLLDERGHIWAKTDSPPVMGLWPLSRWQPGMFIADIHELPIPAGTPPGQYQLEVGWYEPTSGQPLPATGWPRGSGGGVLIGPVQVAWQPLSPPPALLTATTRLAPDALLLHASTIPTRATSGDLLPLNLSWQQARTLESWLLSPPPAAYVMVEWMQNGQPQAEQLDPLPLPIAQWGTGAMLRSFHEVRVPPTLAAGQYELRLTLHTGSDPAGPPMPLGMVQVSTPPRQFSMPPMAQPPAGESHFVNSIELSGFTLEQGENLLSLHLYWRTGESITRRYKIFTQLLNTANQVVAQADNFPAAGHRPTTGWLPGEIITDAHTLTLPADLPPGDYQLISGLYNPHTGSRLLTPTGHDFITLTQFSHP